MTEWLRISVDIILIVVIMFGIVQAMRLINHLRDLHKSRADMERFVRDFNGAVLRAESGIKGLRQAARESGDDLEHLVERAGMSRDELTFIVESADRLAERLSQAAAQIMHTDSPAPQRKSAPAPEMAKPVQKAATPASPTAPAKSPAASTADAASKAEQDLLQALQKLS